MSKLKLNQPDVEQTTTPTEEEKQTINSLEFIDKEIEIAKKQLAKYPLSKEQSDPNYKNYIYKDADIQYICNNFYTQKLQTLQQIKSELEAWRDKSTPKMFKIKKDTDGRIIYVCPNCGRVLVKFWNKVETITMYNYCDNCGQALKYME